MLLQEIFKFPENVKSSLVIIGKNIPLDQYTGSFERGIRVSTTKDLRWKRVDIKSLNLLALCFGEAICL